jgi:predicted metal-dependent hydrolase
MKIGDLDIEVKRSSRRKTLSIFVERDGSVTVLAPETISDARIEEAVLSKDYLLYKKLAKWKELNKGKVERSYVNGQSFLYLGRNYRLNIVEDQAEPLMLKNGYLNIRRKDLANADKHFIQLYKEKGLPKVQERLKLYQKKLKVQPKSVKIQELKNRWASCTIGGSINLHWKAIMAPVAVLDYIIVHELVHLIHPNHSPEFWNELDKVMPDYRVHEAWLKSYGVKMTL